MAKIFDSPKNKNIYCNLEMLSSKMDKELSVLDEKLSKYHKEYGSENDAFNYLLGYYRGYSKAIEFITTIINLAKSNT